MSADGLVSLIFGLSLGDLTLVTTASIAKNRNQLPISRRNTYLHWAMARMYTCEPQEPMTIWSWGRSSLGPIPSSPAPDDLPYLDPCHQVAGSRGPSHSTFSRQMLDRMSSASMAFNLQRISSDRLIRFLICPPMSRFGSSARACCTGLLARRGLTPARTWQLG
jgi:hypothetical protein